jgi:hypothetical protein
VESASLVSTGEPVDEAGGADQVLNARVAVAVRVGERADRATEAAMRARPRACGLASGLGHAQRRQARMAGRVRSEGDSLPAQLGDVGPTE